MPAILPPNAPLGPAELANPATARAWKAAQDFEAMVLGQMLAPMLETAPAAPSPFGGGHAEETWRGLHAQELGRAIARGGGLGLALPVYRQMLAMQEAADQARETP
jgi:Rod binding domain-containing protein